MQTNPKEHTDWQQKILDFYSKFDGLKGWSKIEAIRIFLPMIFESCELSDLYFFTSHEVLCLSRYPNYKARDGKPLLAVGASSPEHLWFELSVHEDSGDDATITKIERVVCPPRSGVGQFQRLLSRLRTAG